MCRSIRGSAHRRSQTPPTRSAVKVCDPSSASGRSPRRATSARAVHLCGWPERPAARPPAVVLLPGTGRARSAAATTGPVVWATAAAAAAPPAEASAVRAVPSR
eukprot:780486-Prymnesium_polylepis.1